MACVGFGDELLYSIHVYANLFLFVFGGGGGGGAQPPPPLQQYTYMSVILLDYALKCQFKFSLRKSTNKVKGATTPQVQSYIQGSNHSQKGHTPSRSARQANAW